MFNKFILFIFSYLPLYCILILDLLDYKFSDPKKDIIFNTKHIKITIFEMILVLLGVLIFSIAFFYVIIHRSKKKYKSDKIIELKKENTEIASYIVTYILPLCSLNNSPSIYLLINFVLFIFNMIVYIRLDLIYLNPVLILFGYNVFSVKLERGEFEFHVITKQTYHSLKREINREIRMHEISDELYFIE